MPTPRLVAHRGYAARYPENTLLALQAAADAGARYVEFDVQMTADQVPVVIHDADLARTAQAAGCVNELPASALQDVPANEPLRFGGAFPEARIPTLAEVAIWLQRHPRVTAFVEIKAESLQHFGTEAVVEAVLRRLAPVRQTAVVISFDPDAVALAAAAGMTVGWVLPAWNPEVRARVEALAPAYVFSSRRLLPPPPDDLWPGPWDWAVYEITDPAEALALAARGVTLVETMAVGEMLADPRLGGAAGLAG